jgi:hypothetical protein
MCVLHMPSYYLIIVYYKERVAYDLCVTGK